MTGHKAHAGRVLAMRQGYARRGRRSYGRSYTRNDLKGDLCLSERLGLLAASSEDEGMSPFKADNNEAFFCLCNDEFVHLILRKGVKTFLLANVDGLRIFSDIFQQLPGRQVIIDDDIGLFETLPPLHRDEIRVPWPGTDEINLTLCHVTKSCIYLERP